MTKQFPFQSNEGNDNQLSRTIIELEIGMRQLMSGYVVRSHPLIFQIRRSKEEHQITSYSDSLDYSNSTCSGIPYLLCYGGFKR